MCVWTTKRAELVLLFCLRLKYQHFNRSMKGIGEQQTPIQTGAWQEMVRPGSEFDCPWLPFTRVSARMSHLVLLSMFQLVTFAASIWHNVTLLLWSLISGLHSRPGNEASGGHYTSSLVSTSIPCFRRADTVFTLPFLDAVNNTCGSWKYNRVKYRVYIGYTHTHTHTHTYTHTDNSEKLIDMCIMPCLYHMCMYMQLCGYFMKQAKINQLQLSVSKAIGF